MTIKKYIVRVVAGIHKSFWYCNTIEAI